jgi:hypothetical protein
MTTTTAMTVVDSQRLKALARDIRTLYVETEELVCAAQRQGNAALSSAILCGIAANEAKSLMAHGEWLDWLAKHCKGVHANTVRNYMRVASNPQALMDLKQGKRLVETYLRVGIIPTAVLDRAVDCVPTPELRRELGLMGNVEARRPTEVVEVIEAGPTPALRMLGVCAGELWARLAALPKDDATKRAALVIMARFKSWVE